MREADETCNVFMSAENRDIIESIVKKATSGQALVSSVKQGAALFHVRRETPSDSRDALSCSESSQPASY